MSAITKQSMISGIRRGGQFMELISDSQAKIQNIAKMLSAEKLQEVLDFMEFLYQKEKGFDYTRVENSAEYVRSLREKESVTQEGQQKDRREFLEELIEWQESSS
jgi:2-oxoglutarate dehydrogenase complex dehydrogenase (E1) component-like enzyme